MTKQIHYRLNPESDWDRWKRNNPNLDSKKYRLSCSDIDNSWTHDDKLMFVEVKCCMAEPTISQRIMFRRIDELLDRGDLELGYNLNPDDELDQLSAGLSKVTYWGYHLLQFENTTPDNGKIFWDGKEITREQLEKNLRFENPEIALESYDW